MQEPITGVRHFKVSTCTRARRTRPVSHKFEAIYIVICCGSLNGSKSLFSRLTAILTVTMVVQIRMRGGTGKSTIILH